MDNNVQIVSLGTALEQKEGKSWTGVSQNVVRFAWKTASATGDHCFRGRGIILREQSSFANQ